MLHNPASRPCNLLPRQGSQLLDYFLKNLTLQAAETPSSASTLTTIIPGGGRHNDAVDDVEDAVGADEVLDDDLHQSCMWITMLDYFTSHEVIFYTCTPSTKSSSSASLSSSTSFFMTLTLLARVSMTPAQMALGSRWWFSRSRLHPFPFSTFEIYSIKYN